MASHIELKHSYSFQLCNETHTVHTICDQMPLLLRHTVQLKVFSFKCSTLGFSLLFDLIVFLLRPGGLIPTSLASGAAKNLTLIRQQFDVLFKWKDKVWGPTCYVTTYIWGSTWLRLDEILYDPVAQAWCRFEQDCLEQDCLQQFNVDLTVNAPHVLLLWLPTPGFHGINKPCDLHWRTPF